eukprot:snap_masked-scaffold_22-processed-gene-1.17-mRNA-1 protein AED:0.38 eAED:0.38 QI:0/-1/0/1/-1/1/1/0/408
MKPNFEQDPCFDDWKTTGKDAINYAIFCVFLVLLGGIMSGLQQGLFQITPLQLITYKNEIQSKPQNMSNKTKLFLISLLSNLIRNTHLVLVTLLVANSLAMETLPIFMDLIMPKHFAILLSVTFLVLFGEIIPQALCLKFSLSLTLLFTFPLYVLTILLFPICFPISRMLDFLLGKPSMESESEIGNMKLSRSGLKNLVSTNSVHLSTDEKDIILGTLMLQKTKAKKHMLSINKIFSIDYYSLLDANLLRDIQDAGHSRIPIFKGSKEHFIGILLTKTLPRQNLNLGSQRPVYVRDLQIHPIFEVEEDEGLFHLLKRFRTGRSHLGIVYNKKKEAIGFLSLEMVIEKLINREIRDEKDEWNESKEKMDNQVYDLVELRKKLDNFLEDEQGGGFMYTNGYGAIQDSEYP